MDFIIDFKILSSELLTLNIANKKAAEISRFELKALVRNHSL